MDRQECIEDYWLDLKKRLELGEEDMGLAQSLFYAGASAAAHFLLDDIDGANGKTVGERMATLAVELNMHVEAEDREPQ